ncbi:MAG: methyl-accepting chemotaxis protein [Methanospirillum sp.]|uniref:HAMP domain-containing methyl-accepting chemotaxis protein n=1 Tax=Methanospirillum sp. TaxID=45200 RepID=UPI00236C84BB|nr:methyl-accepting chemotaxis protein [Methanospirillum sp.]MDD1729775.1 methyl-accepting chemotaxis protein [Methanospirillum sp.]
MNVLDNIQIGRKLLGSFLVVVLIMILVGAVGYIGVTTTNDYLTRMYNEQFIPTDQIKTIESELWQIRGNTPGYLFLVADREKNKVQNNLLSTYIDANLSSYEVYIRSDEERKAYTEAVRAWAGYKAALVKFYPIADSGDTQAGITALTTGDVVTERKALSTALDTLVQLNLESARNLETDGANTVSSSIIMLIIAIIVGAVCAISLGYLISHSITAPLSKGVEMMQEMERGHLDNRLKMNRKDEIGVLARAMDQFSDELQFEIIAGMKKIAGGDLSVSMKVKDERDEISPAFNQLISAINGITGEIGSLIMEAEEGRLQKRGDTTQFSGAYQNIVVGINNMLDAITTPLNEALRVAGLYSKAKFSARFDQQVRAVGEFESLKEGLNTIGSELSAAISDISEQTSALSASSEEAAASIEEITAGSATIAQSVGVVGTNAEASVKAVEQVLTAMEELNTSVSTVAAKVESVSRLTQQTNDTASSGVKQAAVAEAGISAIKGAVHDVDTTILDIRSQMDEINKIVDIISDISDQTNLLALNAAIEAARAGDAGMGFAVVANEVKTLAQESQKSAENIARIISSLQTQSERAATAMSLATSEVSKGSVAITDTIEFFHTIAGQVEAISHDMTEVSSLSEEEAAVVQEITSSVSEVRSMAVETAQEAVGSAAATEESSAALNQVSTIISDLSLIASRINESIVRLNG